VKGFRKSMQDESASDAAEGKEQSNGSTSPGDRDK